MCSQFTINNLKALRYSRYIWLLLLLHSLQYVTCNALSISNFSHLQNEGTCFLFQCGPAQNFRCKFTHHANYTSAVLTPKRKIDPPPPPAPSKKQIQDVSVVVASPPVKLSADLGLSQHEVELSNLKEKPSRG